MSSTPDQAWYRRALAFVAKWWKYSPVTALLALCVVSVLAKENYPFSHFPMYSNPSADRPYFSITDMEGAPVPIADRTGISAPKIGKAYRKKLSDYTKSRELKASEVTEADAHIVAQGLFEEIRRAALEKKKELPERLQLRRTRISYEDDQIVDSTEIIASEVVPLKPTDASGQP